MQKRRVIVTHPGAHFEERLCLFILMSGHWESAEKFFPGISNANLVYWNELPAGSTRKQWENAGVIFIGRFSGEFDEHPTVDQERKQNESAVSLLAKKLGIDRDLNLEKLLRFTTARDLRLCGSPFELPSLLKKMNDSHVDENKIHEWAFTAFEVIYSHQGYFDGINYSAGISWGAIVSEWMTARFAKDSESDWRKFPRCIFKEGPTAVAIALGLNEKKSLETILEFSAKRWDDGSCGNALEPHVLVDAMHELGWSHETIAKWAFTALDAIYERAEDFFTVAAEDFKRAKVLRIQVNGQYLMAVIGTSNSTQFSKYARSSHGCKAGLVIAKNGDGNAIIETRNELRLDLKDVLMLVRMEELRLKKLPLPKDMKLLRGEAAIPNCPEWYGQLDSYRILNGSTTSKRPPTKIPLDSLAGMTFYGLGVRNYNPQKTVVVQQQAAPALVVATA